MSLTPEELAALSQSFKDAMTDTSQTLSNLDVGIRLLIKDNQNASLEAKKFASGVGTAAKNLDALTEAEKAQIKAAEILVEKQRLLDSATQNAKASLGSFANGLLDTNVKLTNYSDAVGKAGDAAWDLGKSFGPLGMVIGGVVKGFTAITQASLKQTQSLLDAKDELNKIGGAGSYTAESIYKMAHATDLNSETLGRLIKPMQGLGSSITILDQGAANSQKRFAELTKVTSEQRMQFMRLGISQEQMIQGQADYLALQSASGVSLKNQFTTTDKLRQASLAYQTNLLDLAALTGKDVKEIKEKQQEALQNRQLMIDNIAMQHKSVKLREQADKETDSARKAQLIKQADAIDNEIKARQEGTQELAGLNAPKAFIDAVNTLVTTSAVSSKETAALARLGMESDVEAYKKTLKEGGDAKEAAAKLMNAYKKKFGENIDVMKDALKLGGDELNNAFFVTTDNMKQYNEQQADLVKATKDQAAKRGEAEKPGIDPAADARAKAQEATITATGKMDDLVHAINPILGGFGLLTAAAIAASLALGGLAAGKLFSGGGPGGMLSKLGDVGKSAAGGVGKYVGKLGGVGKIAGGVAKGAGIGLVGAALDYGGDKLKESGHEKLGGTAGVLGKTAGYAGTGAMIGSIIPGVGTAIGGAVGGLVGAGVGLYDNWGNLFGSKDKGGSTTGTTTSPAVATNKKPSSTTGTTPTPAVATSTDKATDKKMQDPVTNATDAFDKLVSPMTIFTSELDKANLQFKSINEKLKNYNQQFSLMTDDMTDDMNNTQSPTSGASSNRAELMSRVTGMPNMRSQLVGGGGAAPASGGGAAPASGGGAAPASGGGAAPASGGSDSSVSLDNSTKTTGASSGGVLSKVMSMLGFSKISSGGRGSNAGKSAGGGKVGGSMSDKDVKDMIIKHEGKRNTPYQDSLGLWTVGVGHLIGDGRTLPNEWNRKFTDPEIMSLFDKDYDKHKSLAQSNVPGFSKYDTMGQGAFVDLTFNMGGGWPQKFKNTSKSIAMGDPEGAAAGLENSKWFTQVGRRGPEITNMIRNSRVSAKDGGLSMGPESGYPATLHGNEIIVPLDPNSILADLGKKSKQQVETSATSTSITKSSSNDGFKELLNINQAMMEMMSTKLDNVINKLADSHDTQNKILRYSQA